MFAISYDFDTAKLKENYHNASYNNAYTDVRNFMEPHGFIWKQESLLYGNDQVTMVSAVLAVVAMSRAFPWLNPSLKDIRILRIIDEDNMMPAVEAGVEGV